MKFHELPDDLSVGARTLLRTRRVILKGVISRETTTDLGFPPGNVKITVHEKGIRLRNDNNKVIMDIHNAQILGLNIEAQVKSFQKNQNGILKAIYKLLALVTLGAMVRDLNDESSTYTKEVAYLVINFWNTSSEAAQKIFVCSRKKKVEKFIALFD